MHITRTYTQRGETLVGEIDTDPMPMRPDVLDGIVAGQRAHWGEIRESAQATLDEGRAIRYAPTPGDVWECADMAALAVLTRADRRAAKVRWPEDR